MHITITRAHLKKIVSEEIDRYFKLNGGRLLKESNLEPRDIQEILREMLEKSDGTH